MIFFGFNRPRDRHRHPARRDLQVLRRRRHRRLGTVHARLSGWMFLARRRCRSLGVWAATWLSTPTRRRGEHEAYATRRRAVIGAAGLSRRASSSSGSQRRRAVPARAPRPPDRVRARLDLRLHRRPDLGRQRHLLRARDGDRLPAHAPKIVGTDIFHAAALLWVAGFGHLVAGNVDLRTMVAADRLDSRRAALEPVHAARARPRARLGLASVLMLSGIKLIDFSGADYVIAGGAVVGVGLRRGASSPAPAGSP